MTELESADDDIFVPDQDRDGFSIECPDCGSEIRPPSGGHIWKCHEIYGGCGAAFHPIDAFRRVDGGTDDE